MIQLGICGDTIVTSTLTDGQLDRCIHNMIAIDRNAAIKTDLENWPPVEELCCLI